MLITLTFVRQWGGNDQIVWVDIPRFNAAWRRERGYYLRKNAPTDTQHWIVHLRFRKIPMPHVYVGENGDVSFTDGRHRFAWFRDRGIKAIPVTVASRKDAEIARKHYGSRRRIVCLDKSVFDSAIAEVALREEQKRARSAEACAIFGN